MSLAVSNSAVLTEKNSQTTPSSPQKKGKKRALVQEDGQQSDIKKIRQEQIRPSAPRTEAFELLEMLETRKDGPGRLHQELPYDDVAVEVDVPMEEEDVGEDEVFDAEKKEQLLYDGKPSTPCPTLTEHVIIAVDIRFRTRKIFEFIEHLGPLPN